MTLKKKISFGLGFLFIIIFILVIFCSYYVQKLSRESENILRDNYNSIVYSKNMFISLDDMKTSIEGRIFNPNKKITLPNARLKYFNSAKTMFEKNLKSENNNITELHEKEYVNDLNKYYRGFMAICDKINKGRGSSTMYFNEFIPVSEKMKKSINGINDINMQAIVRKSMLARNDSENIMISMAIIGSIMILLAFGYFWYFPFYISNSISFLAEKMKDMLKKIGIPHDIASDDELHIMLQSLNLIESSFSVKENKKRERP